MKIRSSARHKILKTIAFRILETGELADQLKDSKQKNGGTLHRFRVGLRRIQACTRILKRIDKSIPLDATSALLRRLLQATNRTRDEEVLPSVFSLKHQTSEQKTWVKKRDVLRKKLEASLPAVLQKLMPDNFSNLNQSSILAPFSELDHKAFQKRSATLIQKERNKLKKMACKLKKHKKDAPYLHQFRIRAKKFRYVLETLHPLLRKPEREIQHLLEKSQNAFGKIHDLEYAGRAFRNRPDFRKAFESEHRQLMKKAMKEGDRLEKYL
ncbi:MAG: CHAD domain-containing protein [Bdellovibrionales bacterium]|nr:CHAD domain-containing protein [Oligoflexia bacterium]